MPPSLSETQEDWVSQAVERLLATPEESSRYFFLQQNPQIQLTDMVLYLAAQVPRIARDNADRAMQMAGLLGWLAESSRDDYCRARSARAVGHVLQLRGKLRESLVEYQKALDLFTTLNLESEVGITLSGSIQPLILLGDYGESHRREESARKIFKAQGDELRLARLDSNLGNLLHRQDRFEEALVLYCRAEQALERLDAPDDLALVLNNLAVCYVSVRDFPRALDTYQRLRSYSEQRHLQHLIVQADYNIAYLHYLQGDYHRAIDRYAKTRIFCARAGDAYHAALCDLDQAEISLHLNLSKETTQLARKALEQFEALNMKYEAAKAYTFLGLAACHDAHSGGALELFAKARELFVLEQNLTWVALADFYRAIVLYRDGHQPDALKTVSAAQDVLSHSALKDKAALAELLRSIVHMELGDLTAARYWGESALRKIERSEIADVRYLGEFILGRVRESQKDPSAAYQYYQRAQTSLESVKQPQPADSRVSLLKNRDILCRHLISAALSLPNPALTHKPRPS